MEAKSLPCTLSIIIISVILIWLPAGTVSQENVVSILPSRAQFVCDLLNVTVDALETVVENFAFNTKISLEDIEIILYKEENRNETINLSSNKNISLSLNDKLVIIVHGFQSSATANWVKSVANAYHNIGIINTLAINWQKIASKFYLTAAEATKSVGELVGKWMFDKILSQNFDRLKNVHLVGHSLGAHVSGFIAKRISNLTNGTKIRRISGLDVAAPLFEYPILQPKSFRLVAEDAEEVDAYHTNKGFFGFLTATGKQDFYINYGGPIQPGCNSGLNILKSIECSHSFAHELFARTINSTEYISKQCQNSLLASAGECNDNIAVILGQNLNGTDERGTFYGFVDAL